MTALTIVQNACSRLGITAPTAIFSSTDDQTVQLRNLMNQQGTHLARGADTDHAWTVLRTEKTFTTVAQAIQTNALAINYGWIINDTAWNRTTRRRMIGPVSPQEWQLYQAIALIALPNAVFRFIGGNFEMYPSPSAGDTCAYEYASKNWAQTSSAVAISTMTADTDTSLIDEELMSLGVAWRFLAAKGLDYGETFRTYQMEVTKAIGRDGGRKKMNLAGKPPNVFAGSIKEGSWP